MLFWVVLASPLLRDSRWIGLFSTHKREDVKALEVKLRGLPQIPLLSRSVLAFRILAKLQKPLEEGLELVFKLEERLPELLNSPLGIFHNTLLFKNIQEKVEIVTSKGVEEFAHFRTYPLSLQNFLLQRVTEKGVGKMLAEEEEMNHVLDLVTKFFWKTNNGEYYQRVLEREMLTREHFELVTSFEGGMGTRNVVGMLYQGGEILSLLEALQTFAERVPYVFDVEQEQVFPKNFIQLIHLVNSLEVGAFEYFRTSSFYLQFHLLRHVFVGKTLRF